jgi:DNA-binding winged helix-turn-helix (wHTH) protein
MMPVPSDEIERSGVISFGPFQVNRASRLIERDGEVVSLGSRAFDILACLLENAGQVVDKAELLRRVWPNNIVEEGSLRFQINALRKALGEGRYIANVTGQGYTFVAPISRSSVKPSTERAEGTARAPPLEYPRAGAATTVQDALEFAAVHLFVERMASSLEGFVVTDDDAPLTSAICQKLDRLALAIELATGRVGVEELAIPWPNKRITARGRRHCQPAGQRRMRSR